MNNNFEKIISPYIDDTDPAHDLLHLKRVVLMSTRLCQKENANLNVVLPAAWMHDIVNLPKNHPDRLKASMMAAEKAISILKETNYPQKYFNEIYHAIHAHSFSSGIVPETLEAKIVQDADRLDGLGAIGIARMMIVAGKLNRSIYSEDDPFCETRNPNDTQFSIDHFFIKLFKTAQTLQTESARMEGATRVNRMKEYLGWLALEIETLG